MKDQNKQETMGMLAPVGNIDSYVKAINQVPMLEPEDERTLAKRLRDYGDIEAARKLILSHLRLVVSIARSYSGFFSIRMQSVLVLSVSVRLASVASYLTLL